MSHDAAGREVAMFGILDWEACIKRFKLNVAAEIYVNEDKVAEIVPWLLTQGLYKMYYTHVTEAANPIAKCEEIWQAQGNNADNMKEVNNERSLSMSDIAVLSNRTVWLCVSRGWRCLNPGAIS